MEEQEDVELTSPHKHIKIHLHVEQLSWKLTEELLYKQSCKKDLHTTGQEGKKGIWLGPELLGALLKEKKVHRGGSSSWGATIWASQSWGPACRRQAHLAARRTTGTDRRAGEAQTLLARSVCILTCQQSGQKESCTGGYCLTTLPNPNRVNTPALHTPHHSLA